MRPAKALLRDERGVLTIEALALASRLRCPARPPASSSSLQLAFTPTSHELENSSWGGSSRWLGFE